MDRYLGGEDIETSVIIDDLEKAVARGHFYPVIPVCAETGVGLDALLEVLTSGVPVAAGARAARRSPASTARPRDAADLRPGRPAGRRGRQDHHRPVRRPGLAWSGSSPARCARSPSVHVSGHGMAERGHPDHDADERVAHLYSPLGASLREVAVLRRRRHLRDHQVGHAPRPATRSPARTTRC